MAIAAVKRNSRSSGSGIRQYFQRFVRRVQADSSGQLHIGARQIYILPTRYGILFAMILMLMLIGSVNYNNNLGFLLTFFLIALGLVTMVHTWKTLLGLQLSANVTLPAFATTETSLNVYMHDPLKRYRGAIFCSVNKRVGGPADVTPERQQLLTVPVVFDSRGYHTIPRISVFTFYPLGLFRAWCYLEIPTEVLVYPQPGDSIGFNTQASFDNGQGGTKGTGADDFSGMRNYREGDSPQRIHWPAWASRDILVSKQFSGENAEELWFNWAQTSGNVEVRLCQLCRAIIDAHKQNLLYGLELPNTRIEPATGSKHFQQCLSALALFPGGGA